MTGGKSVPRQGRGQAMPATGGKSVPSQSRGQATPTAGGKSAPSQSPVHCEGFPPFFDGDSAILILGSFPSVKSRQEGFYYGNRQNRFWKTLARFYGTAVPETVRDKKAFLTARRIALWDMVTACDIAGSMDKDIRSPVVADLYAVLDACPIAGIFLNGKTAYKLFTQHYPTLAGVCLPSTSPANGRFRYEEWAAALALLQTPCGT